MRVAGVIALLLVGCGKNACEQELAPDPPARGTDAAFAAYDPAACIPDGDAWERDVADIVDERCGSCHGETPSFGAPNTLIAYDGIVSGEPGNRAVDRMALRAALHTMPPATSPQLDHGELDTLVGWATCGEVHPDPNVGLSVNREPWSADVPEHAELPSFDAVADAFPVAPDTLDLYQCFAMDIPVDEPRFLERIQVVLDDARVLHHVVVLHDPRGETEGVDSYECGDEGLEGGDRQLWAWAPGTGAFDFEEGGMPIGPGERLIVQIHYNNAAGLDDVVDSSGVRIFHGPPEGTAWTLAALGPDDFEVPEGDSAVCDSTEVFAPRRLLASMPHMHELGAEFTSWVERKGADDIPLVDLTGWNFEAQHIYRLDVALQEGDVLHTRCGFRNDTGRAVGAGLRTTDEMCFDFVFVGER